MLSLETLDTMDQAELENALIEHNYHYWVRAQPHISDYLYDRLVERLRAVAPDSGVLDAVGTGGAIEEAEYRARIADVIARYPPPAELEAGERVVHDTPMLSLDKCYDEATLRKWFEKFEGDVVVSPKVDGVAVSLKYRNNKLVLASTRGNGLEGELITEAARQIVDLPPTLKEDAGSIEVRGEAVMPLSVFEARFAADFANPRNTTAGGLKQKDAAVTASYDIHFFAYDLLGETWETEAEKFDRLRRLGFTAVETHLASAADLQTRYEDFLTRRDSFDFETDGVVYKANKTSEHQQLGATSHHPRYAIAYKFQGESGVTTLEGVEWSVSRTGAINPVALVAPISLSGATITRISLHNLSIMAGLGKDAVLYLGSELVAMRRGGVIPNIEYVKTHGTDPVVIPSHCPSCGAETHVENEVLFAAHNPGCRTFRLGELEHFIKVIRCDGFGEKILGQLFDRGLINEPADFYKLTVADLLPLDRMGDKLAKRLIANLDAARVLPANLLLRSLSVHELGKHVSALLAAEYGDMDKIRSLTVEEFSQLHTIGESIARSVVTGLAARASILDNLLAHVEVTWPRGATADANAAGPFAGKSVMFTGALESMKREEAQKMVVEAGGKAASSVAKTLDYLVIGDKDLEKFNEGWRSSKLKKAEQLANDGAPLQIISESQFLELLAGPGADDADDEG